jgi:hypothetical protein
MDWCVDCDHYLVCKYVDYDRWSCSRFRHYGNTEEVVRCIDCKHHDIFDDLPYCNHTRGLAGSVSQDGYCYLGERKDNA